VYDYNAIVPVGTFFMCYKKWKGKKMLAWEMLAFFNLDFLFEEQYLGPNRTVFYVNIF
jgi:hypothetical protein